VITHLINVRVVFRVWFFLSWYSCLWEGDTIYVHQAVQVWILSRIREKVIIVGLSERTCPDTQLKCQMPFRLCSWDALFLFVSFQVLGDRLFILLEISCFISIPRRRIQFSGQVDSRNWMAASFPLKSCVLLFARLVPLELSFKWTRETLVSWSTFGPFDWDLFMFLS